MASSIVNILNLMQTNQGADHQDRILDGNEMMSRTAAILLRTHAALYGISDSKECGTAVLKILCDYYGADWCGVFDYDKNLSLWMPYWWHNVQTNGMTPTALDDTGINGDYPRWISAIDTNTPIVILDVEDTKETFPQEYIVYKQLDARSILAVPYSKREHGFIIMRNPTRHMDEIMLMQLLSYVVVSEINAYELYNYTQLQAVRNPVQDDYDVTINLFGGLEIITKNGKLDEDTIKSTLCCKLLVFLLINRQRNIHPREIADCFWMDRNVDDGINHARVLIYRFRKLFKMISDEPLIVTTGKGYRINPDLKVHTDYEEFERICEEGKPMPNGEKRLALFDKAFRLHKGALFPSGEKELWLMPVIERFRTLYTDMVNELLTAAHEQCNHKMLYEYARLAQSIHPDCPPIIFWLIMSYHKDGQTEMAKAYLKTAKDRLLPEEYAELEQSLAQYCPRKNTCCEPCNAMCRFRTAQDG